MTEYSLRPGVFSSYTVTSVAGAGSSAQHAAVAARSERGEVGKAYRFTRPNDLYATLGGGPLTTAALLLLESGVSQVVCVPSSTGAQEAGLEGYRAAFAAVEELDNLGALICGSADAAVQGELLASVERSCKALRERVGLVTSDTTEHAAQWAAALNSERVCLCYPACSYKGEASGLITACAFAGALLSGVVGDNLSGGACKGVTLASDNLAETEVQALLGAGVAVFETVGGAVECIRAVTTRTKTNGAADSSFSNISTVRVIDVILRRARSAMKAMLRTARGNSATLQSIVSQMTVLLASALEEGLLGNFEPPRAALTEEDASVCEVELSFCVASAVNQIHIIAHVSI